MATTKVLKIKLDAETKQALNALKTTQKQVQKNTAGFKKLGGTIAKFVGAAVILKGFKDITKAAIRQENSIKALNVALKNTGESFTQTKGGIDAMSKNLQTVAADIQKVTTVGDEASMEVMQLGLSMGISAGKIGEATKQAIGLSKAYKMDLRASIKMVALAHAGDFNMLQRYIPQLKMAKTTAEKKTIALKAMADGYKIAQAEAETFGGKLTQLGNTFGDFKERVGAGITENEAFGEALDDIKKLLEDPAITKGLAAMAGGVATLAAKLVDAMGVFPRFINAVQELAKANAELNRVEVDQTAAFEKSLEKANQFMDVISDTSDMKRFLDMVKRITNSQLTWQEKTEKLNKLFRDMRDGKLGSGLAEDFEKFRKVQDDSQISAAKLKVETEKLNTVIDKTTKTISSQSIASLDLSDKIMQLSWWMKETGHGQQQLKDHIKSTIPPIEETNDELTELIKNYKKTDQSTIFWGESLIKLLGNLSNVFGALTQLGGPLGQLAGGFSNLAGNVGNLIAGIGGGFGLANLPTIISAGIGAFNSLGSVLGSVGKAIGGFFDMWGDSEWKKLLRSTNDETNAVWDMINTFGMTPGVIDVIKRHLDKLPAGFEATRRALEQLLIDAGVAEKGMKGTAARPALEPDAGAFKPGTDTPMFGSNKNTGSGFNPENDFVSAASGFSGVLKRDTVFKAHKGEPVNITPKNQARMGQMQGGMGDKIDNRRFNTEINNAFTITDAGIIGVVARAMRTNTGSLKRIMKEELKLT
jgi:hypothetical protein